MTLIEVLMVIGVVCVLAALALTGTGRGRASRINCINVQKQVSLAFLIWAGDNDERFPMHVSTNMGGTMELVSAGSPIPHFLVMSNELNTPKTLWCPADSNRIPVLTFQAKMGSSNVSYFLGVDAVGTHPESILIGDDHLAMGGRPVKSGRLEVTTNSALSWRQERHVFAGNVAMADGSVSSIDTTGLRLLLNQTGMLTNRLAMP